MGTAPREVKLGHLELWPERRFDADGYTYDATIDGVSCTGWSEGGIAEAVRAALEHQQSVRERMKKPPVLLRASRPEPGRGDPGLTLPVNDKKTGRRDS